MNLSKLFELQKALDDPYSDVEDRLSKDILWLMEELGELAREWRGHKYRRTEEEQEPKTDHHCYYCDGSGKYLGFDCLDCRGTGEINPLLEEYTDCLSIVLSIGLQTITNEDFDYDDDFEYLHELNIPVFKKCETIDQFHEIYDSINLFRKDNDIELYQDIFLFFIGLGEMLGFTWEQIEENYIAKAKANKVRNA